MFGKARSSNSAPSKSPQELEDSRGSFTTRNRCTLVLIIALIAIVVTLGVSIPSIVNEDETDANNKAVNDG